MNSPTRKSLYPPQAVEALVAASIAQIGYNPSKSSDYPRGVYATSVERRPEYFMPLDPIELYEFQPKGSLHLDWDNKNGHKSHVHILGEGNSRWIQDTSRGYKVAEIELSEQGSFTASDLINNRKFAGCAFTWSYPTSVEIQTPDSEGGHVHCYKIGSESQ